MNYKGRYSLKNAAKYKGNPARVVFRSLWERQVFRFVDESADVIGWSAESVVVPYICKTDNRRHNYFVDLCLKFKDDRIFLIEIKPKYQTIPPKTPRRKTKGYVTEVLTYAKNISKWEAADAYAKDRGWTFQIWNEDTLKNLGIRLLT